jgi:lipopolysaccharide transport system ATP-binding protein
MTSTIAVRATGLGKSFRYYNNKWYKLRGAFLHSGNHAQDFWAIRNLNFELPKGATLGIIGQNGSGKTTLLQLLAGLLKPTEGAVEVRGNLATLLELEGGFQQELTGRENIFVSCGLRGFSKRNVEKKIDQIIGFAELEKFIDHPIKHYSAGMLLRLAFATAINVEPDVLLIDEVFAVGDMAFQHKCANKFRELQAKGTTIVLATHDMMAIKSLCRQALLLDAGQVIQFGTPEDVTNRYLNLIAEAIRKQEQKEQAVSDKPAANRVSRHGSGEAKVTAVEVLVNNKPVESVSFGELVTFRFHLQYFENVPESILGFFIRDRYGNDLIGINTHEEERPIGPRRRGDCIVIDFTLPLHLREGSYSISPGLSYHPAEPRYLDWYDNAAFFQISTSRKVHGFFWVSNEVTIREE